MKTKVPKVVLNLLPGISQSDGTIFCPIVAKDDKHYLYTVVFKLWMLGVDMETIRGLYKFPKKSDIYYIYDYIKAFGTSDYLEGEKVIEPFENKSPSLVTETITNQLYFRVRDRYIPGLRYEIDIIQKLTSGVKAGFHWLNHIPDKSEILNLLEQNDRFTFEKRPYVPGNRTVVGKAGYGAILRYCDQNNIDFSEMLQTAFPEKENDSYSLVKNISEWEGIILPEPVSKETIKQVLRDINQFRQWPLLKLLCRRLDIQFNELL